MLGAVFKDNAILIEVGDGIFFDRDDVDVVAIELFEVAVFKTGTLDAPRMRGFKGTQEIALLWVLDASPLLLGPEVVDGAVGGWVEQVVFVVAEPVAEAPVCPQLLEELLALFGTVFEAFLLGESVEKSAEAAFTQVEEFGIPSLGFILFFSSDSTTAHGDGQIWCALEDLELAGFGSPGLGHLDAGCAGADDCTFLAGDVNLFVGPE